MELTQRDLWRRLQTEEIYAKKHKTPPKKLLKLPYTLQGRHLANLKGLTNFWRWT